MNSCTTSFFFFDNVHNSQLVLTGSFNCTGGASENNWENIVIINEKEVFSVFQEDYNKLLEYCGDEAITIAKLEKIDAQLAPVTKKINGHECQESDKDFSEYLFTIREIPAHLKLAAYFNCDNKVGAKSPEMCSWVLSLFHKSQNETIQKVRGAFYGMGDRALIDLWNASKLLRKKGKKQPIEAHFFLHKDFKTKSSPAILKELNESGCTFSIIAKGRNKTSNYKDSDAIKYVNEDMHHKFFIFECSDGNRTRKRLVTGSGNARFSNPASWENLILIEDAAIVEAFEDELRELSKFAKPLEIKDFDEVESKNRCMKN